MHAARRRSRQTDAGEHIGAGAARHIFQIGEQAQHLNTAQVVVSDKVLRQIADTPSHLAEVVPSDRYAVDPQFTGAGRNQSEHQLEQRALARAVMSDQTEHLALRDLQCDSPDGLYITKMFGDVGHLNLAVCHSIVSNPDSRGASEDACPRHSAHGKSETAGRRNAVSESMGSRAAV